VNAPAAAALRVSREDLRWAREEHARSKRRVIELLNERLGCGHEEFLRRLEATLHMPALFFDEMQSLAPAFDLVPYAEAARRSCLALRDPDGALLVALGDPFDAATQDWVGERIREPFAYRLSHRPDIVALLSREETRLRAMDGVVGDVGNTDTEGDRTEELSIETISATESTVVKLVNSTLFDALRSGASDVHLEATATGLTIRYRIDGVLTGVESLSGVELAEQALSRIKVMSELDIAEHRVPQDGRFKARHKGREIDFRVSVMPSVHGEDAVLRILDKRSLTDQLKGLTLDQLGFAPRLIASVRRLSAEPYGMLLVTGPTGSGKTTSLYAVISEANKGLDKIVTIEDPVEYQLSGVLQIPVNEAKGLTFARGLRSILRHDPDRIMVGEIRDPETAEIAVQAALTGHLVYTTVHANNVFDVIGRFLHMGVDAYSLVSALNAVMAQRLLRVNCQACAAEDHPTPQALEASGIDPGEAQEYSFRRGRGCAQCRGSGYKGRKGIGELLAMTDDLRELVIAREPAKVLKAAARKAGTVTLREAALALVKSGETTLEEIDRVTIVGG